MECNRQKFFLFSTIFCPFSPPPPLNNLKNQNFEKMKTMPGDIIFYKSVPKIMIICYAVSEIKCMTNVALLFILGYFLHSSLLKCSNLTLPNTFNIFSIVGYPRCIIATASHLFACLK